MPQCCLAFCGATKLSPCAVKSNEANQHRNSPNFHSFFGKLHCCLPHFINTYHTSTFNSSHVVRPQTNRTESSHGRATCSKADAQHGTKHGLLLFLGSTARRDEPPHESPHVASWQQMATLSLWHLLFLRPSFQYIFFLSEPHDLFFCGC